MWVVVSSVLAVLVAIESNAFPWSKAEIVASLPWHCSARTAASLMFQAATHIVKHVGHIHCSPCFILLLVRLQTRLQVPSNTDRDLSLILRRLPSLFNATMDAITLITSLFVVL
jgi:hypothetical protein